MVLFIYLGDLMDFVSLIIVVDSIHKKILG